MRPRIEATLALTLALTLAVISPDRAEARAADAQAVNAQAVNAQAGGAAAPAKPVAIGFADLLARRDLWPATAAPKKAIRLRGGPSIPAGRSLPVQELVPGKVLFALESTVFQCAEGDTDVLERARAYVATLTPEQFALTDAEAGRRTELWPESVELRIELAFGNGVVLPAGRSVRLRTIEQGQLDLYDRDSRNRFQAGMSETDFVARARKRLELPDAERQPFFVRSLQAALESDEKSGTSKALDKTDVILVFKGKLGCSRCAAFAPELKRFYERVRPGHPEFEAVFVSSDATAESATSFLREEGFPGQVVAFDRTAEAGNLASLGGQLLPLVYVFDRGGKVLASNHPNGGKPSASDVLADLEKRWLKKP